MRFNHLTIVSLTISLGVATASGPRYAGSVARSTSDCCRILKDVTSIETIFVPGDDEYDDRVDSYFSVTAQLKPKCFVLPQNTAEVSDVLKTLVQSTQCKFAVRSGGHSAAPGANNIKDGVTIDLRVYVANLPIYSQGLLRGVEYHADTGLTSLLPGTNWQSIYDYLDSIGKSVAGGRQGDVGVAGFLLGGGLSLYLYRDGMSCDSIRGLEVVLANGTVVEANANQHADLFKALKGGSSNFGIVTRFDMETFDIRPIWRNTKVYAEDATPLVLGALSRWTDNIAGYQNGSAVVAWTYSPANGEIRINSNMHDVSGVVAHPVYEELSSIPGQLTNIVEFTNISTIAKDNLPRGYNNIWWTITIKNDEVLLNKLTDLHHELVDELHEALPAGDFETLWFFQPFPTYLGSGKDVLGINKLTDNAFVLLASVAVKGKDQERIAKKKLSKVESKFEKFVAGTENGLLDFVYLNYAGGSQEVLSGYGKDNVCQMWEVSEKYDPEGVFQHRLPGGFKLPKAKC